MIRVMLQKLKKHSGRFLKRESNVQNVYRAAAEEKCTWSLIEEMKCVLRIDRPIEVVWNKIKGELTN